MTKVRDFLGKHRLTRLIRMGNSCQIWESINSDTNERFALKVLRPDFRDDKVELGYLKNEYAIAKQLPHPNIIKVYDLVLDGPAPYISMELFSELNIKQALRRGPDSIAFMLDKVAMQCAEALSFMNTQGYVHCDIKPDNFLVSREGVVKLIDFTISQKIKSGIAKMLSRKSKNIQGTRSYMSPEQIAGKTLDQRADVYSFGCVLFEMSTGKVPFTGESPNDLLNKHISAPIPSPLVINDNITSEFAALLRSMMAKQPAQRIESLWEVAKQLRVVKIFKKAPRIPENSIFDDFQSTGRVEN